MSSSSRVRAGQFNNAARQAAYILIALSLPRLGVSTQAIGEWETLLFLGYVLGFGWTTGLLQGFLVKIGELGDERSLAFARRAVLSTLSASALLLLLTALLHPYVYSLLQLDGAPTGWYFFFVLLLARWPGFCFEQALLVTGRERQLLVYAIANALGLIGSLLLPLYLGFGMEGALRSLAGYAGAKALLLLLWSVVPDRKLPRLESGVLTDWFHTSRPLMAYATMGAIVVAVDPWFVNYWFEGDETTFAIFRYGIRELPFLAALINGMTVVAVPLITRENASGLILLRDQSRKLFHYVFVGTIILMVTARYWWTPVFTETFAESLPIFQVYLLIVGCRLVFAMSVLTALNQTRRIYLWALLELVVNVVLSFGLAPAYGLEGIVWATVIASYFHEACLVLYLRYRTGVGWGSYTDLRWYFGYSVCLFLAYLLG